LIGKVASGAFDYRIWAAARSDRSFDSVGYFGAVQLFDLSPGLASPDASTGPVRPAQPSAQNVKVFAQTVEWIERLAHVTAPANRVENINQNGKSNTFGFLEN
jgi:hypothetical protein